MTLVVFGFFAGVVTFQQLSETPAVEWAFAIPLFLFTAVVCRGLRFPAAFLLGFLWTLVTAHGVTSRLLPEQLAGRDITVEGTVVGLPALRERGMRFEFLADSARDAVAGLELPMRLRLSWYDRDNLETNTRWRLIVRLKPPHGFANPGGFDYEGWLFSHRVHATGYVRSGSLLQGDARSVSLDALRQSLADAAGRQLADSPTRGLVVALAMGDQSGIASEQWDVMSATGTTHLMAISGMNIGLIASAVFFLVRQAWRQSARLTSWLPAPKAAGWAALFAAAGYAALAGFSIPTQRAFIMVAVMMWGLLRARPLPVMDAFSAAALAVLVYDPLSIMAPGFWLSFGAVAILFYGLLGRWRRPDWLRGTLHAQGLVFLGLAPFLVAFFGQISLIAPLANLFAVPWVGWLTTPLALIGTALASWFPTPAGWILSAAAYSMELLMRGLTLAGDLPMATWNPGALPPWVVGAALLGGALALAPRGVPLRMLAFAWWLPLLTVRPPAPEPGEVWFTLLDVGQGLAAVARTANHTLVYDTGPAFGETFDAGESVLVPFLRHQGVQKIDSLVIGHSDGDHAGGTDSLLRLMPVEQRYASIDAEALVAGSVRCDRALRWTWDGVDFQFLNSAGDAFRNDNDNSCVLRISAGANAILVTGDIEKSAERALLAGNPNALRAQVLVAPHHGSRTSSTVEFIRAVAPDTVLIPAGYRNRYRFPADQVMSRYAAVGAQSWITGETGALEIKIDAASAQFQPNAFRASSRYYWHWKLVESL